MIDRTRTTRRLGVVGIGLLAILIVGPASVAADTGPTTDSTYTKAGKTAEAYGGECRTNTDGSVTCSNLFLEAFVGKLTDTATGVTHRDQVCVSMDTATFDPETGELVGAPVSEAGCATDLPSGTLSFAKDLSTASVNPTTVTVEPWICTDKVDCVPGPAHDVVVSASFVSYGAFYSHDRSQRNDRVCKVSQMVKGWSAAATVTGTIGELAFGDGSWAFLSDGRWTETVRCKGL